MQKDAVAKIAREVWDTLLAVKQIPPSVRSYVIIQHVVARFKEQYSNEPNIDLFSQCVGEHVLMQPMKNANGLACKVCVLENESREEGHSYAFTLSSGERKLYSFNTLLWHFKQVHVETKLALDQAVAGDDVADPKKSEEAGMKVVEDMVLADIEKKEESKDN